METEAARSRTTVNFNRQQAAAGVAIWSRKDLARHQDKVAGVAAIGMFVISLVGTILWSGGGWSAFLAWQGINWPGVGFAFVYQAAFTYVQYVFCDDGWTFRGGLFTVQKATYFTALLASTLGSLLGYMPLAHPWAQNLLTVQGVPYGLARVLAFFVIIAVAVIIDVLPERMLTKGD
jgi:hypothetical protein